MALKRAEVYKYCLCISHCYLYILLHYSTDHMASPDENSDVSDVEKDNVGAASLGDIQEVNVIVLLR